MIKKAEKEESKLLSRLRRGLLGHGRGVVRGDLPVVLVVGGDVVRVADI